MLLVALALLVATPTLAQESSSCPHDESRQFDFWIGEWNVVNRGLTETGWAETGRATAKIFPILDGCALVELWRGRAWDRKTFGFSVRNYEPASGQWRLLLNWPGTGSPGFSQLAGQFTHGRGEFFSESTNAEGKTVRTRYTFSDITEDSLRWDGARSEDGGISWTTFWIMEFTRRDPVRELPVLNGPWITDGRGRHCDQPEQAQLDHLAGGWEGTVQLFPRGYAQEPAQIRVEVVPILEGCASLVHAWIGNAVHDSYFAVRSWVPAEGRWVQYEKVADFRPFARSFGVVQDNTLTLTEESGPDSQSRVLWTWKKDGSLEREEIYSPVEGARAVQEHWKLEPVPRGVYSISGAPEP